MDDGRVSGEKLTKLILGVKGQRAKVTSVFVQKLIKCWKGHVYFRGVRKPNPDYPPSAPSHDPESCFSLGVSLFFFQRKKKKKKCLNQSAAALRVAGNMHHLTIHVISQHSLPPPPPSASHPLNL